MRFGPGDVSFEPRQYGAESCCFEWLKDHKVGVFVKKSISQSLKKNRNFAFMNSLFTRQHNISLNRTNSKIFDRVSRKCFINNLTCKAYQCDANIACNCKHHSDKKAFFKGNGILMIFWSNTERLEIYCNNGSLTSFSSYFWTREIIE